MCHLNFFFFFLNILNDVPNRVYCIHGLVLTYILNVAFSREVPLNVCNNLTFIVTKFLDMYMQT